MRLDGSALLASAADLSRAGRGYDARLLGYLEVDPARQEFARFDVVAMGDSWGKQALCEQTRPGRALLGVALELARGGTPANRVAPQAARSLNDYFHPDR